MKLLGLCVDFLGIGWAVIMSFIIAISSWMIYLGEPEVAILYFKQVELGFEVWWNSVWWLFGLVAFIRAIRRLLSKEV